MKSLKKTTVVLMTVGICLGFAGMAMAADNDNQIINYEVTAINEINLDDASVSLTVNSATAGQEPDQASTGSTYDITTNVTGGTKKITAAIDTDMAAGLTLQINMTAPTTGTSGGALTLAAVAVDAVTAISAAAEADIAIGYTLDATVAAGVVASASKTVTLTITDS